MVRIIAFTFLRILLLSGINVSTVVLSVELKAPKGGANKLYTNIGEIVKTGVLRALQ
jgi:hypothetical protein